MYEDNTNQTNPIARTRLWYVFLLLLSCLVLVRVFYLQVIQHDYYTSAARSGQFKEYEIPASRGIIEAHDGGRVVPIVLNEPKYTLFFDPLHIEDYQTTADTILAAVPSIAIDRADLLSMMQQDSRYVIVAKKLSEEKAEELTALELRGVGLREESQRAYPQGDLAAQVLGFVNDEDQGVYGVEQALNDALRGVPGELRAVTDARGVPLAANPENISVEPKQGSRVLLTLDVGLQKQLEDILESGLEHAGSDTGGALIIDANTGAIKAMANLPSYNPARFTEVSQEESHVFTNDLIASPLEIGSIMKPFTMAAALDSGVVDKNTTYYDPNQFTIDGATITNVAESSGVGIRSMEDILQLSLNTGATWLLKQMGGGEINEQARTTWHSYMTEKYFFGSKTGIEQGYEATGSVPSPVDGFGLNIQYANTAFGQGMTATPLQAAAAFAAIVNGGTYYQPRLVDAVSDNSGGNTQLIEPVVKKANIISPTASRDTRDLLLNAFSINYRTYGLDGLREGYDIGGKTGTAQVPNPEGGYYDYRFNGTFIGFVEGLDKTYVIIARVDDPSIGGYAGSTAAGPIFTQLAEVMIDSYGLQPKAQ